MIPLAWRGDWNLSVVLRDEASGATTGGTLYLTNIHRLYDNNQRRMLDGVGRVVFLGFGFWKEK